VPRRWVTVLVVVLALAAAALTASRALDRAERPVARPGGGRPPPVVSEAPPSPPPVTPPLPAGDPSVSLAGAAPLALPRAVHSATALPDGSVLVAGGCVTDGCSVATATSESSTAGAGGSSRAPCCRRRATVTRAPMPEAERRC